MGKHTDVFRGIFAGSGEGVGGSEFTWEVLSIEDVFMGEGTLL
jgi:hypothetical protein